MAFELADHFRNPAIVLADGFIGQMMEPVDFPMATAPAESKPWAVRGDAETRQNLITSIYMSPEELEKHVLHLEAKYATVNPGKEMYEKYRTEDAELVVIGYGIVSRLLRSAVDQARALGLKVGLFRPITLWPFPAREIAAMTQWVEKFLTVELSNGQLIEDVRLAVDGQRPVRFYSRVGGMVPTTKELLEQIVKVSEEKDVRENLSKTQEFLWAV
jgi:pyruvate/2-oxoacid:ferredoxin oxidoreductase alpha subunit